MIMRFKIENFLWPWEKSRFDRLKTCVENTQHQYVCKIRAEVERILAGKYRVGEGGLHIWVHRKGSNKRLAIVLR